MIIINLKTLMTITTYIISRKEMGNAHDDIYNHDDVDDDDEGKRGSILAGRSW